MTQIIGLLGGKGAGKSTAAAYLVEKHGAKSLALACPLKEMLRGAFGLTQSQLYGSQEDKERTDPRYNVSPRWLMTHVGEEGCRAVFGDDFWVDRLVEMIRSDISPLVVVEDVRYANEAAVLRAAGAHLIRLQYAPGLKQWPSCHRSEQEWQIIPVDVDISPGHGLRELYAGLDQALHVLGIRTDNVCADDTLSLKISVG